MENHKILYKIRNLVKLVFRKFLQERDFDSRESVESLVPTPTQMQIIEYILNNNQKEIYQKDLENILKLRRATVSGVLKTMEKNKLIERITYEEDTRAKRIVLNDKAKEIFYEAEKKVKKLEEIITKDISESDLDIFCKVIEKMEKNIDNIKL